MHRRAPRGQLIELIVAIEEQVIRHGRFGLAEIHEKVHDRVVGGIEGEANQALARIGVYATGAAFLLWSLDLMRDLTLWLRLVGVAGLAAGLVPAALLATAAIRMNVGGAMLVYAVHVAWAASVGLMLIRSARTA